MKESVTIPLSKNDTILFGKWKNKKAIVKGFSKDDKGQPVIKTDKKDLPLLGVRLTKEKQFHRFYRSELQESIKRNTVIITKNPQITIKALNKGSFMALAKNLEVRTLKDLIFDETMIAVGTVNDLKTLKDFAKKNGMNNDDYTIYQVAPHLDRNNNNSGYEFSTYQESSKLLSYKRLS